jgi:hypothetical protein
VGADDDRALRVAPGHHPDHVAEPARHGLEAPVRQQGPQAARQLAGGGRPGRPRPQLDLLAQERERALLVERRSGGGRLGAGGEGERERRYGHRRGRQGPSATRDMGVITHA